MAGTRMEGQMRFPAMSSTPGLAPQSQGPLFCVRDGKGAEEPRQGTRGRVGRQSISKEQLAVS